MNANDNLRLINDDEYIGPILSVKWIKETAAKFNVSVNILMNRQKVLYIFEIIGEKENRQKMIKFLKGQKPLGIPFEYVEIKKSKIESGHA